MDNIYKVTTNSDAETIELAENIESEKFPNMVICLNGDLGSGKTVFTKGFASVAKVNGNIINTALQCPHKLSLRVLSLKVKPPQNAFARLTLIILNKFFGKACGKKITFAVSFQKVTAVVAKNFRLNFAQTFDF